MNICVQWNMNTVWKLVLTCNYSIPLFLCDIPTACSCYNSYINTTTLLKSQFNAYVNILIGATTYSQTLITLFDSRWQWRILKTYTYVFEGLATLGKQIDATIVQTTVFIYTTTLSLSHLNYLSVLDAFDFSLYNACNLNAGRLLWFSRQILCIKLIQSFSTCYGLWVIPVLQLPGCHWPRGCKNKAPNLFFLEQSNWCQKTLWVIRTRAYLQSPSGKYSNSYLPTLGSLQTSSLKSLLSSPSAFAWFWSQTRLSELSAMKKWWFESTQGWLFHDRFSVYPAVHCW